MQNPLEVKFGSIYTTVGKLIMMDNIGIVVHKDSGLVKWGRVEPLEGVVTIKEYYLRQLKKYNDAGLTQEAESLSLIEFDRYEGVLSIEEICSLCNYFILACPSYERIMKVLGLDEADLHSEIKDLQAIGY